MLVPFRIEPENSVRVHNLQFTAEQLQKVQPR